MGEGAVFKILAGGAVALASFLWGGLDNYMTTLLVFLAVDFITGTMVALKTKKLSAGKSFEGFTKKIAILFMVAVAVRVDVMMGGQGFIRTLAIYGYAGTELYSITENAIKLKIPVPVQLAKYFKIYMEGAQNGK